MVGRGSELLGRHITTEDVGALADGGGPVPMIEEKQVGGNLGGNLLLIF